MRGWNDVRQCDYINLHVNHKSWRPGYSLWILYFVRKSFGEDDFKMEIRSKELLKFDVKLQWILGSKILYHVKKLSFCFEIIRIRIITLNRNCPCQFARMVLVKVIFVEKWFQESVHFCFKICNFAYFLFCFRKILGPVFVCVEPTKQCLIFSLHPKANHFF